MQRNGGAGPRHTAPNGSSAIRGTTNGTTTTTNGHRPPAGSGRSVSPRKSKKSKSPPRSRQGSNPGDSPRRQHHHRVSLEEGIELSREPWRQGRDKFGPGWAATEEDNGGVVMGGASSSRGGSKGYAEVDRDEPLLGDGARDGEPKQPQNERCVLSLSHSLSLSLAT